MEYTFKRTGTSETELRAYAGLLTRVFPCVKKYSVAFLDWQYRQNPSGSVIGFDAFWGDEVAAHYVTIPVEYILGDEEIRGLLSLNTATDPGHQGRGLFTRLAQRTYALGSELGYRFAIGVANQNSSHAFIHKLGFSLVAPLEVKLFTGTVAVNDHTGRFFRECWERERVAWRLNNPAAQYYANGKSVVAATHIPPIHALMSEREEFSEALLKKKSAPLKMCMGLNLLNAKTKPGMKLPETLKPSPLNLIIKALGEKVSLPSREDIFFEAINFDAY